MTPSSGTLRFAALLALAPLCLPLHSADAEDEADKLVLVTLDGVRWQEVFGGIDAGLVDDQRFTAEPEFLKTAYWHEQRAERRKRLFPFLWSVIDSEGVLIGDRDRQSTMEVTNDWWFSYPSYNEILTGRADPAIDSNARRWNANVTFLEALDGLPEFNDRVLVFGSWDAFPYIINTERSAVPVNAGFALAEAALTEKTRWLNEVSAEVPTLWSTVRADFLTHGYAMEALESRTPRVIYIAYGETDDFAHDGSYDRYIDAAHRTDLMLSKLWDWLQASPDYRGRTTMIITTDHGRGRTADTWTEHASPAAAAADPSLGDAPDGMPGSDEIWLAAIGPGIEPRGLLQGHWKQSQIAATALISLRLDPSGLLPDADVAITEILR